MKAGNGLTGQELAFVRRSAMKIPEIGTYWDGKLMHLGEMSIAPGMCFRLCENPGDPFQVKSPGQGVANAVPTCLRCVVSRFR
jgi:hypothetical protein